MSGLANRPSSESFELLLKSKFDAIRSRNPSFSLRAYAKRLGLHPAALSEILNGKRRVSPALAERLSHSLDLTENEREEIFERLQQRTGLKRLQKYQLLERSRLSLDQYFLVSEWQYYAILSLSETEGFQASPEWIASRLGISPQLAKTSFDRLVRLGYFTPKSDGEGYVRQDVALATGSDVANASLRRRHATNLEAASEALEKTAVELREFTFITMAIDPKKIPDAKNMIREFRDRLCAFMESGEKREVYELCVQLFPRSRPGSWLEGPNDARFKSFQV